MSLGKSIHRLLAFWLVIGLAFGAKAIPPVAQHTQFPNIALTKGEVLSIKLEDYLTLSPEIFYNPRIDTNGTNYKNNTVDFDAASITSKYQTEILTTTEKYTDCQESILAESKTQKTLIRLCGAGKINLTKFALNPKNPVVLKNHSLTLPITQAAVYSVINNFLLF